MSDAARRIRGLVSYSPRRLDRRARVFPLDAAVAADRWRVAAGCRLRHRAFQPPLPAGGPGGDGYRLRPAMIAYARARGDAVEYMQGSVLQLPFAAGSFDYVAAVTSLCFVEPPRRAAEELWRVSRRGLVLGLLNRHSLLYRQNAAGAVTGGHAGIQLTRCRGGGGDLRQTPLPLQPAPYGFRAQAHCPAPWSGSCRATRRGEGFWQSWSGNNRTLTARWTRVRCMRHCHC